MAEPERLPSSASTAIRSRVESGESVHVSTMSTWEVAMLVDRGRLELTLETDEWIGRSEAVPEIVFVPVDNRIALKAVHLEDFDHRDPVDRIIVATAMILEATLVTADERIRRYGGVLTVWD